jgi:tetratricopeptide (TPR) repeat protein
LDAAIEQYRQALLHRPNNAEAHNNLANALMEQGQLDDAVKHYRNALFIKPNFVEAQRNQAILLNWLNRIDAKLADCAKFINSENEYLSGERDSGFEIASQLPASVISKAVDHGVKLHKAGKLSQAQSFYQLVREIVPDQPDAIHLLGVIAHETGRDELAFSLISRALGKCPDEPTYHNNLGLICKALGKCEEAAEHYRRAIFLKPDFVKAHNNLNDLHNVENSIADSNMNGAGSDHVIYIISATRMSENEFWNDSALGISLRSLKQDKRLKAKISFENKRGLPDVFNGLILAPGDDGILVFVHDDVWVDDFFFADHVIDGLEKYDVIGVAGNRRRIVNQAGWGYLDEALTPADKGDLSGSIAHGDQPFGVVSSFGPMPGQCELLDGVIIAAKKSSLISARVRFDSCFDFHFYDIDFCRTARKNGLRIGTWPIYLTHQSEGAFGSPGWHKMYKRYIEKWKS